MIDAEPQDVAGRSILFVMATTHEYGPHLQQRIKPLITGVGPVEAAARTAGALAALAAKDRLPDLVFSLGSAGSRILEHAGVYQISSVAYRDMDASPLGFERGVTPFSGEPAVVALDTPIRGLPAASISTGGAVISGAAYVAIGADMVDMESWAVYRAARLFGVAMIGLRGITDGRDELIGLASWTDYLHIVDEKLAAAVAALASKK